MPYHLRQLDFAHFVLFLPQTAAQELQLFLVHLYLHNIERQEENVGKTFITTWLPDVVSTHPSVQTPSWNVKALQEISTELTKLQVPLKALAKQLLAQSTGFPSPARQFVKVESF